MDEASKEYLVFVYGTLREGGMNHSFIDDCPLVGTGRTAERYAMYTDGILPYVVKGEARTRISGEVYLVNQDLLKLLDQFEGHPQYYCREEVDVVLSSEQTVRAWLYFHPSCPFSLVMSGDFFQLGEDDEEDDDSTHS